MGCSEWTFNFYNLQNQSNIAIVLLSLCANQNNDACPGGPQTQESKMNS